MRSVSTFLCTFLLALGCGGAQDASSGGAGGEGLTAAAEASGHLTISEMQIDASSGQSIRLWADGRVQIGERAVGLLYSDGRFVSRSGEVIARLESDGRVAWGDDEPRETYEISERGEVTRDGEVLTADGSGLVTLAADGEAQWQLEFDGPREGRRAALFVALVAWTADEERQRSESQADATTTEGEAAAEGETSAEGEATAEVEASGEVSVEAGETDSGAAEGDDSGDEPAEGDDDERAGSGAEAEVEVGVGVNVEAGGEAEAGDDAEPDTDDE